MDATFGFNYQILLYTKRLYVINEVEGATELVTIYPSRLSSSTLFGKRDNSDFAEFNAGSIKRTEFDRIIA